MYSIFMPRIKKSDSDELKFTRRDIPISRDSGKADFFSNYDSLAENSDSLLASEGQLSCDIYQDKDNIYIRSTIAGVEPKNLDIAVANDVLTIRGFREEDDQILEEDYYNREIYWGAFSRSVVLPQEIEQKKVEATLKNGVLTVKLPKKYKTTSIKIRHIDD